MSTKTGAVQTWDTIQMEMRFLAKKKPSCNLASACKSTMVFATSVYLLITKDNHAYLNRMYYIDCNTRCHADTLDLGTSDLFFAQFSDEISFVKYMKDAANELYKRLIPTEQKGENECQLLSPCLVQ